MQARDAAVTLSAPVGRPLPLRKPAPARPAPPLPANGWQTFERVVAACAMALLGVEYGLGFGLTPGYLCALVMLPVTLGHLRGYWGSVPLYLTAALTLVSGVLLAMYSKSDHRLITNEFTSGIGTLVGVFAGVALIVWARTLFRVGTVGALYSIGMFANIFVVHDPLAAVNPLKFSWSMPIAVLVLSLAASFRRSVNQLYAIAAVAGLCVAAEFRSLLGTALVAAMLVIWQLRPTVRTRSSWVASAAMTVALAAAVYYTVSQLLVDGFLGPAAQTRSVEQIDSAGSLIVGGRPEMAASWALFTHQPWGFGLGISANASDITIAKAGLRSINYDPDNNYVDGYMFGGRIELHSTAADLWAEAGIVGLLLALLILIVIGRSVALSIAHRTATALSLMLGMWTVWNLLFSPVLSTVSTLVLALGLLLTRRAAPPPAIATGRSPGAIR